MHIFMLRLKEKCVSVVKYKYLLLRISRELLMKSFGTWIMKLYIPFIHCGEMSYKNKPCTQKVNKPTLFPFSMEDQKTDLRTWQKSNSIS